MAQGVKLDDVVRQNIARFFREGTLSGNQIAKQLGVSRDATQRCIKQLKNRLPPSDGQGHPPGSDPASTSTAPTPEPSPIALVIDPEFYGLIPALTGKERARLELNLREEGCRDPLVVWPQPAGAPILLDGHNRYEICQQLGLAFAVVEARGLSSRDDAKIWIITNQLGRRNLTDFQQIELAEKLRHLLEAKAKAKQQGGGREKVPQDFAEPVETRQAIAEIAGVSRETVRKAEVIMAEADEPTKDALRRGKRKIHGVYQGLRGPRTASHRKAVSAASATAPGAPTVLEPGLRLPMAERLIELAGAILEELANWRQQYPQDPAVGGFALMEKHLRELQAYFTQKKHEMAERSAVVAVAATGPTGP